MNRTCRKWTWLAVGACVIAVSISAQTSFAQCSTGYEQAYAPSRVRIDYGPAYRGPATYATVDRVRDVSYRSDYVQPARHVTTVVRSEPLYAPVVYASPSVAYVDYDNYSYPTRRIYRQSRRVRHYATPRYRGHHVRINSHYRGGYRGHISLGRHSGHGRGFGLSISSRRGHHGRRHSGVSFSYRR